MRSPFGPNRGLLRSDEMPIFKVFSQFWGFPRILQQGQKTSLITCLFWWGVFFEVLFGGEGLVWVLEGLGWGEVFCFFFSFGFFVFLLFFVVLRDTRPLYRVWGPFLPNPLSLYASLFSCSSFSSFSSASSSFSYYYYLSSSSSSSSSLSSSSLISSSCFAYYCSYLSCYSSYFLLPIIIIFMFIVFLPFESLIFSFSTVHYSFACCFLVFLFLSAFFPNPFLVSSLFGTHVGFNQWLFFVLLLSLLLALLFLLFKQNWFFCPSWGLQQNRLFNNPLFSKLSTNVGAYLVCLFCFFKCISLKQ